MKVKTQNEKGVVKTELGKPAERELDVWAKLEGRSKQQHAAVLLRKLIAVRKSNPDALSSLGLLDRQLAHV